jgi:hypothetical protein
LQKFLDFEQLVAAHCFIVFKVLASLFESLKHSEIHMQDGAHFKLQDFIYVCGRFPEFKTKYVVCWCFSMAKESSLPLGLLSVN